MHEMQRKHKVHSLTGRITEKLMKQSFKAVKRNRGAAGIDKVSVKMFEANLEENLRALMRDLKTGDMKPKPLRRSYIPKDPGNTAFRPLGIPVVRDRVGQEVLRRLLNPIFEPMFHQWSFGFISGRNCHMAIEQVLEFHTSEGLQVVLDAGRCCRREASGNNVQVHRAAANDFPFKNRAARGSVWNGLLCRARVTKRQWYRRTASAES